MKNIYLISLTFVMLITTQTTSFAGHIVVKGKASGGTLEPPLNGPGSGTVVVKCTGEGTCAKISDNKIAEIYLGTGTVTYSFDSYKSEEKKSGSETVTTLYFSNAKKIN
jgi:hypothetical protein